MVTRWYFILNIKALGLVVSDMKVFLRFSYIKIVSEHNQEIPQSQAADKTISPQGRASQPSRDTRKTN